MVSPQTMQISVDGMAIVKTYDMHWLMGLSEEGDAVCSVEGECIVGSGLGKCTVNVEPAKAVPMGSTDPGYQSEVTFNNISMNQHEQYLYTKPETDVTVVGHSSTSHWNLCWKAEGHGVGRTASQGANVEDYCFYVNGICFLWASPCSGGCSQFHEHSVYSWFCPGLRYATEEEWWAAVPTFYAERRAFYDKCAAVQLDPLWSHCDYSNAWVRVEDNHWNELVLVCGTVPPGTNSPTPSPPPSSPTPFPDPHTLPPSPPPTPSPTPIPTILPSPSPTSSPTSPTGGTTSSGVVAATGDPHLQNVFGERFDLVRPGKHVLVNIPQGESAENAMLRVDSEARQLGGHCKDMYFQEINITGEWVEATLPGGLRFQARNAPKDRPEWIRFVKVSVKVAHGRTQQGAQYLNFYVKHLGRAGFLVGGLLGEDDHKLATTPTKACLHRVSLLQTAVLIDNGRSYFETTDATNASQDNL